MQDLQVNIFTFLDQPVLGANYLIPHSRHAARLTSWSSLPEILVISNPGVDEIFRTRSDLPWGPPSLLYIVYHIITGGRASGPWP